VKLSLCATSPTLFTPTTKLDRSGAVLSYTTNINNVSIVAGADRRCGRNNIVSDISAPSWLLMCVLALMDAGGGT